MVGSLVGKREMRKGQGVRGLTFLSLTFLSREMRKAFSSLTFSGSLVGKREMRKGQGVRGLTFSSLTF